MTASWRPTSSGRRCANYQRGSALWWCCAYVEDLSERDTAELMGIRPGTVKSQAASGLARLRARLGEPAMAVEAIERREE